MIWIVSPGAYSPMRLETVPALPTVTPLTFVIMSPSLRPAWSPGPPVTMEEFWEVLER